MAKEYIISDFINDAPPRTFGSETEYTSPFEIDVMDEATNVKKLPHYLSSGRSVSNSIILKNGGELYVDYGGVLEYATPECSTPDELVLQERAGEEITLEVIHELAKTALVSTPNKDVQLFKRTGYSNLYDTKGELFLERMSTGHHENYTSSAFCMLADGLTLNEDLPYPVTELASYLATRSVWAGAGMVTPFGYSLTQKQYMIDYQSYGNQISDGNKTPMLFHDDRVEVRSGDGNISEWVIRMKYALTSLVLRLIEHDEFPSELCLVNPTVHSNILAENPEVKVPVESGEMLSAIEHQSRIIDIAYEKLSPRNFILPFEEHAVEEFDAFKKDFKNSSIADADVSAIADRVDWAAKLHTMHSKGIYSENMRGTNMRAVATDLRYEQMGRRNHGRMLHAKLGQKLLTIAEIRSATLTPPRTRALRRVKAIRHALTQGDYRSADWDQIICKGNTPIPLGQPY